MIYIALFKIFKPYEKTFLQLFSLSLKLKYQQMLICLLFGTILAL